MTLPFKTALSAFLLAGLPCVAAMADPDPKLPVDVGVHIDIEDPPAEPWCGAYLSPVLTWTDTSVTIGVQACSDGLRQTTRAEWWTGFYRYDSDAAEPFSYFRHEGGCTAGGSRYLVSVRECRDTYTLRTSDLVNLDTEAGSFGYGFVTNGDILLDDLDASRYISYDFSCGHFEESATYHECRISYSGSWYHS